MLLTCCWVNGMALIYIERMLNMCNITFQFLRLSRPTFVFTRCSEKYIFTVIFVVESLKGFGWNNVGPASQTVAQHYISIGPMYGAIWCFWRREVKRPCIMQQSENTAITQSRFNDGPALKTVGQQ